MSGLSWKKPFILAVVLAALATVTMWVEYRHRPAKEAKEEQSKRVMSLKDASLASISIIDGSRRFSFKCLDAEAKLCKPGDNSKWEMTEPLKTRADDSNVGSLVSGLSNLNHSDRIDLGIETAEKRARLLKEYKLDRGSIALKESRRIEVKLANGDNHAVYFGETHPIGDTIFIIKGAPQPDESAVLLVPTYFKSNFEKDMSHWRDKKLMTFAAHEIEKLEIAADGPVISAVRKDGQWILAEGASKEFYAGDNENIENLLSSLAGVTAKKFTFEKKSDKPAFMLLRSAKRIISLSVTRIAPKDAKPSPVPVVLDIYEKYNKSTMANKSGKDAKEQAKTLYATVSGADPVYEIEPSARSIFTKKLKDLRLSRIITAMERFNIKRIELSGAAIGAKPLVLAGADSKWIAPGESSTIKPEKVQALLDNLSAAGRVKDFMHGKEFPFGEQSGVRIALGDEKEPAKKRIVVWKSGDKLYARDLASKRMEAMRLDDAMKEVIPWVRDAFFEKPAVAPSATPGKPGTKAGTR
ncbi:MAG: hypothetical protein A2583_11115 [Bdellovibrionales bacterium RIFOXYD1_FULL_53_11]|nr:MAG: hypothetical protein A2583_11115 [Bdellovibrionales bacterium RIFOXYD1_FULL_53_11]